MTYRYYTPLRPGFPRSAESCPNG